MPGRPEVKPRQHSSEILGVGYVNEVLGTMVCGARGGWEGGGGGVDLG